MLDTFIRIKVLLTNDKPACCQVLVEIETEVTKTAPSKTGRECFKGSIEITEDGSAGNIVENEVTKKLPAKLNVVYEETNESTKL